MKQSPNPIFKYACHERKAGLAGNLAEPAPKISPPPVEAEAGK